MKKISVFIATLLLLVQTVVPAGIAYAETLSSEEIKIATETDEEAFDLNQSVKINLEGATINDGEVVIDKAGLSQKDSMSEQQIVLSTDQVGVYQVSFHTVDGRKSNLLTIEVKDSVDIKGDADFTTPIPMSPDVTVENTTTGPVANPRALQMTMVGSPNPVTSKAEVTLDVTVSADAGDLQSSNGDIIITIPRGIVYSSADLTNIELAEPFIFMGMTYDTQNYYLRVAIDDSNINENDAFYGSFQIKFGAPLLREGDSHADSYDVLLDYAGNQITETLNVKKSPAGVNANFSKSPRGKFDSNGIYLLDLDTPKSVNNTFQLIANYAQVGYNDLVIEDILPSGTVLDDPALFPAATGNQALVNHVRIMRATNFDAATNTPSTFEYVTQEYADAIKYDEATNKLTVSIGQVAPNEGYVVEYAVKVINPEMGIQYNNAQFYNDDTLLYSRAVPVRVNSNETLNIIFSKSVDKALMNYDDKTLDYTIKTKLLSGTSIPAGTVLTDELDSRLSFDSIVSMDESKFSYQLNGNTLTFTALEDLPVSEQNDIVFRVDASNLEVGEKVDNVVQTTVGGSPISSGVAETKKYDGRVEIIKVDQDGNPLKGATFEIRDTNDEVVYTGVTSEDGTLYSTALAPGDYSVIETEAPTGYLLDETLQQISIANNEAEPVQVTFVNQVKLGSVVLKKVDEKDNSLLLENAVFDLLDKDGTRIATGLTTDENGEIQVEQLKPGRYSFVETKAPNQYLLDSAPVDFEVEFDQQQAVIVTKTNQRDTGTITLTKVDEDTGEKLAGAEFELQTAEGVAVETGLISDEKGEIVVSGLEPEAYQFVEVKAPDGYQLDTAPIMFEVVASENIQAEKDNQLIPGSVILEKVDAASKEVLAKAEFELQDSTGKTLQTGLMTDENGQIEIKDLRPGDYQFVETKAPEHYQLDKEPIKFTIVKNQQEPIKVVKTNQLINPSSQNSTDSKIDLPYAGESLNPLFMLLGLTLILGVTFIWLEKRLT